MVVGMLLVPGRFTFAATNTIIIVIIIVVFIVKITMVVGIPRMQRRVIAVKEGGGISVFLIRGGDDRVGLLPVMIQSNPLMLTR